MVSISTKAATSKAIGLFLGTPDSITLKIWNSDVEAFDLGASFSSGGNHYHLYGNYIHHVNNLIKEKEAFFRQLDFYVGGGAFIISTKATPTKDSKTLFGARVPFGVEWRPNVPIAVYVEVALGLSVIPETTGYTFSGLGVRYIF